ncbi:hypothetical protein ARMSODRAFT_224880 [Armillaria solidipes]|uniref:Uncharacterized protein n=1 Tax=Armillaria solidipes TaxID=1076256 RepID=A0A2H3CJV7_9AGAR|nr:hypothetical protein ARMSODRAFT_224880 [Armillaria solidipes]
MEFQVAMCCHDVRSQVKSRYQHGESSHDDFKFCLGMKWLKSDRREDVWAMRKLVYLSIITSLQHYSGSLESPSPGLLWMRRFLKNAEETLLLAKPWFLGFYFYDMAAIVQVLLHLGNPNYGRTSKLRDITKRWSA